MLRGKIHQHVAAEDHVIDARLPQLRIVACQIAGVEFYSGTQGFIENHLAAVRAEPLALDVSRRVAERPGRVARACRLFQYGRVEIHRLD